MTYERIRSIGSSDVAVILGLSKYCSQAELYDKITGAAPESPTRPIMDRGKTMEAIIAEMYRQETGREAWPVERIFHPTIPAHATPDLVQRPGPNEVAIFDSTAGEVGLGVVEIKSPGGFILKNWRTDGFPRDYYAQLQHEMLCANAQWGTFVALDYDQWQLWYVDVTRDQPFIDDIVAKIQRWWVTHIDGGVRPVETFRDDDGEQWPLPSRRGADLYETVDGAEWQESIKLLKQARENKRLAEHEERLCANRIKTLMGERYTAIQLPSGEKVSWKESTSRHFDKDRLAEDHPEIEMERYYNVKPTRSFRPNF